ncbi:hypothetical protein DI392_00945 [Vibrio albus]|uniref:AlpA family phage regulatory protein n=1 Tax=Vibrio albus TaxID=2200953 RepID=A0A2U3BDM7_9VIBR|nr:helix-turn-helix domain-containing protein [Vibrio albus]PWI34880.1 hypothetical protein DI392_00945 [Vibrio albus]
MQISMKNMTADSFGYSFPTKPKARQPETVFDPVKYPESSNQLMSHKEVQDLFGVKRGALNQWRKNRGFPSPVTNCPLRWLRSAVMEWLDNEGGFKG